MDFEDAYEICCAAGDNYDVIAIVLSLLSSKDFYFFAKMYWPYDGPVGWQRILCSKDIWPQVGGDKDYLIDIYRHPELLEATLKEIKSSQD